MSSTNCLSVQNWLVASGGYKNPDDESHLHTPITVGK